MSSYKDQNIVMHYLDFVPFIHDSRIYLKKYECYNCGTKFMVEIRKGEFGPDRIYCKHCECFSLDREVYLR